MPLFTFFFGREKWSAIDEVCAKLHEIGLLQGDGAERLLRANRKQAREFKVL